MNCMKYIYSFFSFRINIFEMKFIINVFKYLICFISLAINEYLFFSNKYKIKIYFDLKNNHYIEK